MNATPSCTEPSRWNGAGDPSSTSGSVDVVHRYVAGTLPADTAREFELHLLTCGHCVERVREGVGIRAALMSEPPRSGRAAAPPDAGVRRGWYQRGGALSLAPGMAAAALVAAVLFNMRATPLERLGEIATPPAYQPVAVRAARDSVATMTDSGMVAYASGDYAAAERLLARVAEVQHTSGGMFFLGVSRLMLGRTDGALDALRGAVEPSGNPYSLEARFYLAKAWLRAGNADSALAQLLLIPVGSKLDIGARALEDSTRAALLR